MFAKLARFQGVSHRHAAPSKPASCNDNHPSRAWSVSRRARRKPRLSLAAHRQPVGSNAFGKSCRSTPPRRKTSG